MSTGAAAELRANGRTAQCAKQSTCIFLGPGTHWVRAAGTSGENGAHDSHRSKFECRHLDPQGTPTPSSEAGYREARIGAKLRRSAKSTTAAIRLATPVPRATRQAAPSRA